RAGKQDCARRTVPASDRRRAAPAVLHLRHGDGGRDGQRRAQSATASLLSRLPGRGGERSGRVGAATIWGERPAWRSSFRRRPCVRLSADRRNPPWPQPSARCLARRLADFLLAAVRLLDLVEIPVVDAAQGHALARLPRLDVEHHFLDAVVAAMMVVGDALRVFLVGDWRPLFPVHVVLLVDGASGRRAVSGVPAGAQALLTNSHLSFMAPMPSILQSMSW